MALGPAIYLIPHQDDEPLTFGGDIQVHLSAGREVIVVLYTSGENSGLRDIINGLTPSNFWGGTHNPTVEGYPLLSDQDLINYRTHEFISSCGAMGIKPANVHIRVIPSEELDTDGKGALRSLLLEYHLLYPNASFKVFSWKDTHPHHSYVGHALLDLYDEGVITDARFFVSRYHHNSGWISVKTRTLTSEETKQIERSAMCYRAWNPASNSFALGYHSVSQQFANLLADPRSRIHLATDNR